MRLLPVLVLPLLTGCGTFGESFELRGATCGQDFTKWSGGLTHHILQGTGNGAFDYDPEGNIERRVVGGYDLHTGEFEWDVSYAPDHWRTATEVRGYGYANENGDLDVLYTRAVTDVLGNTSEVDVREERVGCDVTVLTAIPADGGGTLDQLTEGTFVKDAYEYTRTLPDADVDMWIQEGTLHSDLTWEESYDFVASGVDYQSDTEGDAAEGHSLETWSQARSDSTFAGTTETGLDGGTHWTYTVNGDEASWDYELDYGGTGTGTYSQSGLSCDVTFTVGDCEMDCDNGQHYDCG